MPMLIQYMDKIAREIQRDILIKYQNDFLVFIAETRAALARIFSSTISARIVSLPQVV